MSIDGLPLCRICLCEDNTAEYQMISICKCAGTMQYIHVNCLKEWIDSKKKFKKNDNVTTYLWKGLTCELCKTRFPDLIPLKEG
jgi:E3 ubiquitin-protein ligase DOA10